MKLGELLLAIDGYQRPPAVYAALALSPMVSLRPGELRKAKRLGSAPETIKAQLAHRMPEALGRAGNRAGSLRSGAN